MSVDDHDPGIPWSVASFLEKEPLEYTHRDWEYVAYLEQTACESVEAEESKWSGVFSRMAVERPQVHYADGTS